MWIFTNFPSNCKTYDLTNSEETNINYSIGWPFIVTYDEKVTDHFASPILKGGRGCNIISHYPFDSKEAYQVVKNLKMENALYSPGVHYGLLPQIMSGFDTRSIKKINSRSLVFIDNHNLVYSKIENLFCINNGIFILIS